MNKLVSLLLLTVALAGAACFGEGIAEPSTPPPTKNNCEEHIDCGEGYICQGGICAPGECAPGEIQQQCNTSETPENLEPYCCQVFEQCNSLGQCETLPDAPVGNQCYVDADCPNLGQFCSGGNCFETGGRDACTSSFQCPADERCDRTVFLCVPDNGGCTFAEQFPELACESTQLCDAETGFCVDPGEAECTEETVAEDCRPNQLCDNLGRCVQCIGDDDCGPGTACNVGTGSCYSIINRCDDDSDCEGGRRCSPATSECVNPECEGDNDCDDSRELCDLSTFTCYLPPATCESETDEPNDTTGSATPISLSGYAGTICRGNTDFLSFPIQPGKRYRATVSFPDYNVQGIVAEMRNSEGLPTDSAIFGSFDNEATVSGIADADETGSFTLRITGSGTEEDIWSYTVDIVESEAPQQVNCADETTNGIEPNNTFAEAHEITVDQASSFARCGNSDVDFFKVTVPELHGLEVTVEMESDDGDLDVTLYGEENGSSIDTATTGNDVEKVEASEGTTTFWIKVALYSGDNDATTNQTYTVLAKALPRPSTCDADLNEPDTTIEQAGVLDVDMSVEAIRCGSADVDVFEITLPANRGGNLRVDFLHSEGDLRLDLMSAAGDVLESSNQSSSTTAYEVVPLPFSASEQIYYARVRLHGGTSSAPQTYTISTATFDASQCTASEPVTNDTFHAGTCVGTVTSDLDCSSSFTVPGTWPDLAACSAQSPPAAGCGSICGVGDPDYYRAGKLNNGQLLRAKLTHDASVGAMGVALVKLGPDGETLTEVVLDNNAGAEDVIELNLVAPSVNEAFVREYGVLVRPVAAADYTAQPYAIEIEVGAPCEADPREPNDDPAGPARLRENPSPGAFSTTVSDATLCGGDVDVYEIFVFDGETVTATLTGLNGVTVDIGTRVFGDPSEDAITVACGQGVPDGTTPQCPGGVNEAPSTYTSPMVATHDVTLGDYYYLSVRRMPNGGIGAYVLNVEVAP